MSSETIKKRNIYIAQPSMGQEEWEALKEPIFSGWVTQGPKVKEFERMFSERHQVDHAFAVTSCTTGLHLALVALGIQPGDEVIVPAFTWVSTVNVVLYCGATPVFVDVDPKTFNLVPEQIKAKITDKTKAIIAVHLFGLCADMDAIKQAAPDIAILEDAACASGAGYKGKPSGSLGDIASFSFHPRKSITTGEGGMVTTNREDLAEKVNTLRNHGASISEEQRHHGPKPYILPAFDILGYNYRMTDLQGALGIVQFGKLDQFINERNEWAKFYQQELKDLAWLQLPDFSEDYQHGWQAFVCMIDETKAPHSRNKIMELLQERGISTRPGTHAVHMLDYYVQNFGFKPSDFPGAQAANDYSIAIPLHNKMTQEDYQYVVQTLKEI
ncbi:perosamine synthetase [marine bacterium AO1-C]|nr:perosamine synthetase [marine bacterium AO1-C]